ncbi:MAG TPA: HAD-IG family 5'-nucleotidase [Candidatus Eisenbacteria bacterium]
MSLAKQEPPSAGSGSRAPQAPAREPSARALRYREHRIPRRHRVFVNRNLRLSTIRAIGFDLDHTLAHYDPVPVERLAFELTKKKLVEKKGYPEQIRDLQYDPEFVVRGLVVDKKRGNCLKMDYFNYVSRGVHGLSPLRSEERNRAYRTSRVRVGHENYVSVDTLFHLPEVYLYLSGVELLERGRGVPLADYTGLYEDVRAMIDEAHADGSLKSVITAGLDSYVRVDQELRTVLEEFRRSGKKLFLLTNSDWRYADTLLQYILARGRAAPEHWSEVFDFIVVDARKPFFYQNGDTPVPVPEPRERGLKTPVMSGGSASYLERAVGAAGEHVLYFGDHTYGDILQSKKLMGWRTAMLVPELDREIQVTQEHAKEFERLGRLSAERHHIEIEKAAIGREFRRMMLMLEEHGTDGPDTPRHQDLAARLQAVPGEIGALDQRAAELLTEIESLRARLDRAYNVHWGSLFREGNESSRFGHQLKDFACVYTSRVTNFLHYPWNYYFQSPVSYMPHDF